MQPVVAQVKEKSSTPVPSSDSEFEFADTAALSCLLCSRKFSTLDQLKRHNKESDLHKVRSKSTYRPNMMLTLAFRHPEKL